jgi:hypothetical protein
MMMSQVVNKTDTTTLTASLRSEDIETRDTKLKKKDSTNNLLNECSSICTVYLDNTLKDNNVKIKSMPPHISTIAILFVVNLVNYIDRFTIAGKFKFD